MAGLLRLFGALWLLAGMFGVAERFREGIVPESVWLSRGVPPPFAGWAEQVTTETGMLVAFLAGTVFYVAGSALRAMARAERRR